VIYALGQVNFLFDKKRPPHVTLLAEDLVELRQAGLSYQAEKVEGLRRLVLSSHPDLVPRRAETSPLVPEAPRPTPARVFPSAPLSGAESVPPAPTTGLPPGRGALLVPAHYLDRVLASLSSGDLPRALFWGKKG
jgi:hypothetical protein